MRGRRPNYPSPFWTAGDAAPRGGRPDLVITQTLEEDEKLRIIRFNDDEDIDSRLQEEAEKNWFPCEKPIRVMFKGISRGWTQRLIYGKVINPLPKIYGQEIKKL